MWVAVSVSERRYLRARGTKAWNRDRLAYIADWAWPFVERYLARLLPGERIFRGIDRWKASDYHRERPRALGLPPLRLHDSTLVLKVYGRFIPRDVEWAIGGNALPSAKR